jgi:hypothetical protein
VESVFAEQLDDHLGELARHYSRSDNVIKAVEYLGRSGQQALQRSAHADAISSLTAATNLLQRSRTAPSVFSANCVSNWPLVQRQSPLRAGRRRKWSEFSLVRGSFASGWVTPRSFSPPWLDSGPGTICKASY